MLILKMLFFQVKSTAKSKTFIYIINSFLFFGMSSVLPVSLALGAESGHLPHGQLAHVLIHPKHVHNLYSLTPTCTLCTF